MRILCRPGIAKGLGVGVDGDEADVGEPGVDHPIDGVAAATTDADDHDRPGLEVGGQHVPALAVLGQVDRVGAGAEDEPRGSRPASFSGVCPPRATTTPIGRSASMTFMTSS